MNQTAVDYLFEKLWGIHKDKFTWQMILKEAKKKHKKEIILRLPKKIILFLAKLGDIFKLPLNSERLKKLTESYVVSNNKIVNAIGKPLPIKTKEGLMHIFKK